ncbi:ATP-binding protein [Actinoplanes sp. NEAU-A12]|uniref:ATP-binding protein n=1 Tax=Actinoplanes sandaracinus TaxID=3045177 RepID=A0ABT6WWJ6_9ACTN|nr:ATP-binding protein [Actinoplanes sandaracinus]MDI6104116.1 ATP-binding protein [Actinoplanes sandaracinus]
MTAEPIVETVLSRVRLRAALRAGWLRSLWADEQGRAPGWSISHAEVDTLLAGRDGPAAEADWAAREGDEGLRKRLAAAESALDGDRASRLAHLCRVFRLAAAERDLVQACLGAAVDPALSRVYGYLQDDAARQYVTDHLVGRLYGHRDPLVVDPGSALFTWDIVLSTDTGVGEPPARTLDPAIRDWLLGSDALDPEMADIAGVQPVLPPLADWPLDDAAAAVNRWLSNRPPTPVRVRVAGLPGSGRRSFAAALAGRMRLPLLTVDLTDLAEDRFGPVYLRVQRRAFLDRCAPAFVGDPSPGIRRNQRLDSHFPLQFVIDENPAWTPPAGHAVDHLVELPAPSLETRRALWRSYAPWSADWPADDLEKLVTQHRTRPADLELLHRRGPSTPACAGAILRDTARDSLGDLARRLDCPFERGDLVVTDAVDQALDDLLFEARNRAALWEQPAARRLFPQGRGLLALFCGPPGTGKTMSAQVIAAALGQDLFRIDLATVVSKWVGETSRNVDRLLRRAASQDVVLLFDEADALFGRRTEIKEANDRFANTDTGYLLQAIESYEGIALLSTNRRGDIDPAFLRRIRYVLDYPLPDAAERLRLWGTLVGALAGAKRADALAGGLARLAAGIEVTGAQIKFAVLTAMFAARRDRTAVTLPHLVSGLRGELAKEDRPLAERIRERLVADDD